MKIPDIIFRIICVMLFTLSCSEPVSENKEIETVNNDILEPVSYLEVELTDNFWKPKIEKSQKVGLWHALHQLEESIMNFDIAAGIAHGVIKLILPVIPTCTKLLKGLLILYIIHQTKN